jgi:hypothetical protein
MKNVLSLAAGLAAAASFASHAAAQNCYDPYMQCWSFAPRGSEIERLDTGVSLRSKQLSITGDLRLRVRGGTAPNDAPYPGNGEADQQAARARVQMNFQATEKVRAKVELLFAETWAGSESYSDALGNVGDNVGGENEQLNKLSMAYVASNDLLGLGEDIRVGRSDYFLSNGLILGSCDFLQYPSTFTGVWLGRKFGPVNTEIFLFDDYGPLQNTTLPAPPTNPNGNSRDGTRFAGGTAKWSVCDDGVLTQLGAYVLVGTQDGDATVSNNYRDFSNDHWVGLDAKGSLPLDLTWSGEAAKRDDKSDPQLAGGNALGVDPTAYRAKVGRKFSDLFHEVSVTRTDSEGALQVNPGDFNSAGLLHQYAGAWRSDLDTWQFGAMLKPGWGLDVTLNVLTLDHDGATGPAINQQLGHTEFDAIVAKTLDKGVHVSLGGGIDNQDRQVGYFQMTVYF